MLNYQPITLADSALMNSYFNSVLYRNCDFSFSSIFCWQKQYQTTYALVDGFLVIRYICDDNMPCYMMPIGTGDMAKVLHDLIADAALRNERFRIHAITSEMFAILDAALPNTFSFEAHRDYFEYIYLSQDLITLSGKRFQHKRNHINRFKANFPNWQYMTLTDALVSQCRLLYQEWAKEYEQRHPHTVMPGEAYAVEMALKHHTQLNLRAGAIFVEDKMVAFSLGQAVTCDTFVVYVEKALVQYPGAFQLINQQLIANEAKEFEFINREEDLGLDSLRQAKMSYNPVRFLERGSVYVKE